MSLIDYLNELIGYSMGFPFYQRLNPLFNGISNEDTPFINWSKHFGARGPRAPKCFDHLIKGRFYWISH